VNRAFLRDLAVPCAMPDCETDAEVQVITRWAAWMFGAGCYCRPHGEAVLAQIHIRESAAEN
jgi:hypothetical protein